MADDQKLILIVEDELDTAEMFAEMLAYRGYKVKKIHKSAEAIKFIRNNSIEAVLLDIMLPDASGLEVLKFVRADDELKGLPIVVVSAKAMPEDIEEGFKAGADEYLTKPVSYQKLAEVLENAIKEKKGLK